MFRLKFFFEICFLLCTNVEWYLYGSCFPFLRRLLTNVILFLDLKYLFFVTLMWVLNKQLFLRATAEEKNNKNQSHLLEGSGENLENDTSKDDMFLTTDNALSIYASIIISTILLTLTRTYVFVKLTILASKNLHDKMFHCLLLSPLKFFNTIPCGRILNRFSKDMGAIDELLPGMLLEALQVTFEISVKNLLFKVIKKGISVGLEN